MPIRLAGTSKQIIAKREMDYNVILFYGCGNSLYVARQLDGDEGLWDSGGCMMCMACIHVCPMAAIRMRIPEKNPKARYRNENISICVRDRGCRQSVERRGGNSMEFITLNTGAKMPLEGFGVFQIPDAAQCEQVVYEALKAGYRLLDTAAAYRKE